jgi:hypothetical protein
VSAGKKSAARIPAATFPGTVNDAGVIVGGYTDSHGTTRGFVDRRGVFTKVNHRHAGTAARQGTQIGIINDHGAVSGTYLNSRGKAISFAGRPGAFTTITDPAAAPLSTFAGAINNSGVIVGEYLGTHGVSHGFIDRAGVFHHTQRPARGHRSWAGHRCPGHQQCRSYRRNLLRQQRRPPRVRTEPSR